MVHNFNKFPELTNAQMDIYYFQSPHKQIFSDFNARVMKVHDGDTITVRWSERDFDFPVRFANIAAPELKVDKVKNPKGEESKRWLEQLLLGQQVEILINPNNRVEKWGRLLGTIQLNGVDVGFESSLKGFSVPWEQRNDGIIPKIKEMG